MPSNDTDMAEACRIHRERTSPRKLIGPDLGKMKFNAEGMAGLVRIRERPGNRIAELATSDRAGCCVARAALQRHHRHSMVAAAATSFTPCETGSDFQMQRLDRFLSRSLAVKRGDVRWLLAGGRVEVDGDRATGVDQLVQRFSEIRFDGRILQAGSARYVMLNKPKGVVSATRDDRHRTVIDLLTAPWKDALHIVGRLDLDSTGLMLLTNDGQWSRALSRPESKQPKRYRVTVRRPLVEAYVEAFRRGFYFGYEDITTRPAELVIRGEFEAEVCLVEGRYHQIRRMFSQLGNEVLGIHRFAVGALTLDARLAPGESRVLTTVELESLARRP